MSEKYAFLGFAAHNTNKRELQRQYPNAEICQIGDTYYVGEELRHYFREKDNILTISRFNIFHEFDRVQRMVGRDKHLEFVTGAYNLI